MDNTALFRLTWFRIRFTLFNTRYEKERVREHLVSVVNGIILKISGQAGIANPVFHLNPEAYAPGDFAGKAVTVSVMLPAGAIEAEQWMHCLRVYFSKEGYGANFGLKELNDPEHRTLNHIMDEIPGLTESPELCLNFLWPLPLVSNPKTIYSAADFFQKNLDRINRLFALDLKHDSNEFVHMNFLSHCQTYTRASEHISKSSGSGEKQWLQGFIGPMYINGQFNSLIPLLALCSEWHAGNEISNSMGYYSLIARPQPFFDKRLISPGQLHDSITKQYNESDYFDAYVAGFENPEDCTRNVETKLSAILDTGEYHPLPARAITIPKIGGGTRLIEQLQTEDEILQQYLHEQWKDAFDNLMNKSCIGFRKGFSRKKSAQMLEEAIRQGFTWVIHTDIEDYFPSINHSKLIACIRRHIPLSDEKSFRLLCSAIKTPVEEHHVVKPRERGIAQGSSLSPMLANLYLDEFDEYVSRLPVQLIRFADDLLILCRSEGEAASILNDAGNFLDEWGLHFKKEKTFICLAMDPFVFLGLQFVNGKLEEEKPGDQRFRKKPVFITEPYAYLSFHKNAMQVHVNKTLADSIPLDGVSSVIVHYQAVISGVLISKCLQAGVPLTLTLSNAYHLTTIKPNTKAYHDIITLHGIAFYNASEAEKLFIARQIAIAKFTNILPLFKQRYTEGTAKILEVFEKGIGEMEDVQSLDELRGHEGILTRKFYGYLNELVQDDHFILPKRDRNGKDPMNGLLNFSSYLLMAKINSIVRSIGLNPYLGFLHSSGNDYESLVFDILEMFRGRLYRFLLRVINLKIIQEADFVKSERGVFLSYDARKEFIRHFEKELNSRDKDSPLTLREQVYAQVVIIKNWACEQKPITVYQWHV